MIAINLELSHSIMLQTKSKIHMNTKVVFVFLTFY